MRRIAAIILGLGVLLILSFGAFSYQDWRAFPDNEKRALDRMIANGEMLHCDGRSVDGDARTPDEIRTCFLAGKMAGEDIEIHGNGMRGIALYTYRCQTGDFAAEFEIRLLRNDYRIWCSYRTAQSMTAIEALPDQEAAITDIEPGLLRRVFIGLYGDRDRSFR